MPQSKQFRGRPTSAVELTFESDTAKDSRRSSSDMAFNSLISGMSRAGNSVRWTRVDAVMDAVSNALISNIFDIMTSSWRRKGSNEKIWTLWSGLGSKTQIVCYRRFDVFFIPHSRSLWLFTVDRDNLDLRITVDWGKNRWPKKRLTSWEKHNIQFMQTFEGRGKRFSAVCSASGAFIGPQLNHLHVFTWFMLHADDSWWKIDVKQNAYVLLRNVSLKPIFFMLIFTASWEINWCALHLNVLVMPFVIFQLTW